MSRIVTHSLALFFLSIHFAALAQNELNENIDNNLLNEFNDNDENEINNLQQNNQYEEGQKNNNQNASLDQSEENFTNINEFNQDNFNQEFEQNNTETIQQSPQPQAPTQEPREKTFEDYSVREGYQPPIAEVISQPNQFSGTAPAKRSIRELADGEAPEIYSVESGDTLFDICDQLLGEPGYWPKLWALNPYIKNPHFIWPGMRLRFYPGDQEAPPYLEIVQDKDLLPIDTKQMKIERIISEQLVLDPQMFKPEVSEVLDADDLDSDHNEFLVVGNIYNSNKVAMQIPGYIFKDEKETLCEIISGTEAESMAFEGMSFICEPDEKLKENTEYTVIRLLYEYENEDSGNDLYAYQYVAQIRIKRSILDADYFLGDVLESRYGIEPGDIVVPYLPSTTMVSLEETVGSKAPTIAKIMSFGNGDMEFGGRGSYVFLNKGLAQGFQKGQVFQLHQFMHSLIFEDILSKYPEQTEYLGNVRIIDVTEHGSIAYIIDSKKEVYRGDVVGL